MAGPTRAGRRLDGIVLRRVPGLFSLAARFATLRSPPVHDVQPPSPVPTRLNGWKDIANYLDKGIRTVQRWEKHYGLPVHRLGEEGGEIVFAYRDEVDAWLRAKARGRGGLAALDRGAEAQPADSGPGFAPAQPEHAVAIAPGGSGPATTAKRPRALLLATLLLLAAVGSAVAWLTARRPAPVPASWKVEFDTLKVYDASGQQLWEYRFEGPVHEDYYLEATAWGPGVAVEDLDGDSRPEVVVVALGAERAHSQVLRCFNADGTLRWQRRLDDRVRFGQDDFGPPWAAWHFKVLHNADGTRSVWAVFIHGMWFPSVLERIDHDGTVRSRYWSNGYVESLLEGTWRGRRVLLAGACNNERKASSLAILDPDDATATAPAANPAYRCTACPGRDPIEFLVFPGSAIRRAMNEPGAVEAAWTTGDGGLVAMVAEHHHDAPLDKGIIYFTLGPDLRPVKVEATNRYVDLHNWFYRAGRVERPYSPDEWQRWVPILRWQDGRYVELAPPAP